MQAPAIAPKGHASSNPASAQASDQTARAPSKSACVWQLPSSRGQARSARSARRRGRGAAVGVPADQGFDQAALHLALRLLAQSAAHSGPPVPRVGGRLRGSQHQDVAALGEVQMLQDTHPQQHFVILHAGVQVAADARQLERTKGKFAD